MNGEGVEASYQYNGLGYRTGKSIKESLPDPEKQVRYTIDLPRQYHNLLQKEGECLSFLWDGGAAGMRRTMAGGAETEGMRPEKPEYYLQDDLGSPIRLLSESGELTESYGYDEFGRDLYGNQGEVQPFGYTGYQYDRVSDTYFARAREYVPGIGRFAGQDTIKESTDIPYSLNEYGYCWGNPLMWIDLNGLDPATAAEGYEAHKLLQDELKTNPNVEVEKPIQGYGRADIVYNNNGISEVYEIKPASYAPGAVNHEAGVAQLQRYITGFQMSVAAIAAAPTGGASLIGAACIP